MGNLIDQLRERVAETKREHDEARQQEAAARAIAETLASELAGYTQALQAELRRSNKQSARDEHSAMVAMDAAGLQADLDLLNEPPTSKARQVDDFIRSRDGVTPADIKAEFDRRGTSVPRSYLYSMLQRLLAKNRIRRKRGKYYGNADAATAA